MKNENSKKASLKNEKKFSTFSIILIFVIIALGITWHINNVLTVNELVIKNEEMRRRVDKLRENNESLKNEIEKLSSLQRILPLAESLGLEYNKNEVKFFEVDK